LSTVQASNHTDKDLNIPMAVTRVFLTVLNRDFAYTIQTQEMVCYILLEVP
jgi:hypothetical protein